MNKFLFHRLTSINDLLHVVHDCQAPASARWETARSTQLYARRACILHIFRFVVIHLVRAALFPVTSVDIYVFTWALRFDILFFCIVLNKHCSTLINYIITNKMRKPWKRIWTINSIADNSFSQIFHLFKYKKALISRKNVRKLCTIIINERVLNIDFEVRAQYILRFCNYFCFIIIFIICSLGGKLDGMDGERINYYLPLGRDSVAKHCAISWMKFIIAANVRVESNRVELNWIAKSGKSRRRKRNKVVACQMNI